MIFITHYSQKVQMRKFNPLTPMNDQCRISPQSILYNIKQMSYKNKVKYNAGDNQLIQY